MDAFAKVLEGDDPSVIGPLLLMRPYPSDHRLDEIYTIVHSVEAYPLDTYLEELMRVTEELCRTSPYLLKTLLIRLLYTSTDTDALIIKSAVLSPSAKACVATIVASIKSAYPDPPDYVQHCDRLLRALEG